MNQLYPIIRRARRPLLPPDEPQQRVVIPVSMEPEPVEAVPVPIVSVGPAAPDGAPDVSDATASAPAETRAPVRARKKGKLKDEREDAPTIPA